MLLRIMLVPPQGFPEESRHRKRKLWAFRRKAGIESVNFKHQLYQQ